LLLDVFDKEESNEKLKKYVFKKNEHKSTALNYAQLHGNEKIEELMIQKLAYPINQNKLGDKIFGDRKEKLDTKNLNRKNVKNQFVMKVNKTLDDPSLNKTLNDPSINAQTKIKTVFPQKRFQSSQSKTIMISKK